MVNILNGMCLSCVFLVRRDISYERCFISLDAPISEGPAYSTCIAYLSKDADEHSPYQLLPLPLNHFRPCYNPWRCYTYRLQLAQHAEYRSDSFTPLRDMDPVLSGTSPTR